MLDHVDVRVSDRATSRAFYDALLAELGQPSAADDPVYLEWGAFGIVQATAERPVTRDCHIAFRAASRRQVDAFWERGRALGAADDGPPGPRPHYGEHYYGAFLRDPDGLSIEAVHDSGTGDEGVIDHLTLGTGDLAAARAFAQTVLEPVGWQVRADERHRFRIGDGQTCAITFIADGRPPTTGLHLGLGVPTAERVHRFHDVLVAAGYRSDGAPGPRPEYAAGYYGAFVLDPAGNSWEAVARVHSYSDSVDADL